MIIRQGLEISGVSPDVRPRDINRDAKWRLLAVNEWLGGAVGASGAA